MLSGPELARLLKEFEIGYLPDNDPEEPQNYLHHVQGITVQKAFQKQVNSLSTTIAKMGNPFLDDFEELVSLDNRICMDESIVTTVRTLEDIGRGKYQTYRKNVIEKRTHSIHDTIKKNSLTLFKTSRAKTASKHKQTIRGLQDNVGLFGQLYVSLQNREGDMQELFAHETQSFPPSISDFGKLHLPRSKSDLLKCLVDDNDENEPPSTYDCKVLDGAVIVHSLPTTNATTFDEYASKVFIPYLVTLLQRTKRVDIVWDKYIKESTRDKRGKGLRRKVAGQVKLPGNWSDFLRDPTNKEELFSFLTSKVEEFDFEQDNLIYITAGTPNYF